MNSLERVQAAFRKEATDRVPVLHIGFSSAVASALLSREAYVGGGIQRWREAAALWQGEDAHREFIELFRSRHADRERRGADGDDPAVSLSKQRF